MGVASGLGSATGSGELCFFSFATGLGSATGSGELCFFSFASGSGSATVSALTAGAGLSPQPGEPTNSSETNSSKDANNINVLCKFMACSYA